MTTVNATPDPGTTFKRGHHSFTPEPERPFHEKTYMEQLKTPGNRMGTTIETSWVPIAGSKPQEQFSTGAVRDSPKGKGRYTRVTLEAIRRLALVLEEGEEHYPARNWELGMPVERCLDSSLRHIFKYLDGWDDEDHLGKAFWNLHAAVTIEERAESGRLPKELLLDTRQKYIGHPEAG